MHADDGEGRGAETRRVHRANGAGTEPAIHTIAFAPIFHGVSCSLLDTFANLQ